MAKRLQMVSIAIYIIGFFLFWLIKGWLFATVFSLIWIDRMILSTYEVKNTLGFELISLPIALIGAKYGPIFGFLFGLLILPLLDIPKYFLSGNKDSPPIALSFDILAYAFLGGLVGFLAQIVSPIGAMIAGMVIKEMVIIFKSLFLDGTSVFLLRAINLVINLILFIAGSKFIIFVLS